MNPVGRKLEVGPSGAEVEAQFEELTSLHSLNARLQSIKYSLANQKLQPKCIFCQARSVLANLKVLFPPNPFHQHQTSAEFGNNRFTKNRGLVQPAQATAPNLTDPG